MKLFRKKESAEKAPVVSPAAEHGIVPETAATLPQEHAACTEGMPTETAAPPVPPEPDAPCTPPAADHTAQKSPVTQSARLRLPLTHRTAAKVTAFLLCILSLLTAAGAILSAAAMADADIYTTPEWAFLQNAYSNLAISDGSTILHYLYDTAEPAEAEAVQYLSGRNIATVEIRNSEASPTVWRYDSGTTSVGNTYSHTWYHRKDRTSSDNWYSYHAEYNSALVQPLGTVEVSVTLFSTLTVQDSYYWANRLISAAYTLRYAVYPIAAAAILLAILCFVFLLCAAGHRQGLRQVQPGWGTGVPIDLLTAGTATAILCAGGLARELMYSDPNVLFFIALLALLIVSAAIALGWCMSFALRWKLGRWWQNSICWRILCLSNRMIRRIWHWLRAVGCGGLSLLRSIPLVWKTSLGLTLFALTEAIAIVVTAWEPDNLAILWFLKYLLLTPLILYLALTLRRLQKGGEALASGDLDYQLDTKRMPTDFRRHGENLNAIGQGMTAAVEQRLRSERMKTELITNVSHDIKTPLTSIINYADLISKEPVGSQHISEYAEILHRQSTRLKRLIDDLVEASKASTGNLEVLLAPCEAGVLLTQAAGEYEQRMQEQGLTLVSAQPESPLYILADGRRLWRVVDNLMNNILKYGQRGTRVYLTLEARNGQAVITFRNTSRDPLNLSADAFMERFVQGDSSRAADGNGLGLSIAKSLTELQRGTMDLTVDGDLFKVTLQFPLLDTPSA